MINQQINFLKTITKETVKLPSKTIFKVGLGFLIPLFLASIGVWVYQKNLANQYDQIMAKQIQAGKEMQKMVVKFPLLAGDTPIQKQVKILEKKLAEKRDYYIALEHEISRKGFSEFMLKLAKVTPTGLWLKSIVVDQGARDVSLTGYSIKAGTLSFLVSALRKSSLFASYKPQLFYVSKQPKTHYVQFEIAGKTFSKNTLELLSKEETSHP